MITVESQEEGERGREGIDRGNGIGGEGVLSSEELLVGLVPGLLPHRNTDTKAELQASGRTGVNRHAGEPWDVDVTWKNAK